MKPYPVIYTVVDTKTWYIVGKQISITTIRTSWTRESSAKNFAKKLNEEAGTESRYRVHAIVYPGWN